MLKRLCLIVVLLMITPMLTIASETKSVLILPFSINASSDLSYLKNDIPKMLERRLEKKGIVIKKGSVLKGSDLSVDDYRSAGLTSKSDFVIWGNINQLGSVYSLDAKVIETSGTNKPVSVFSEVESLDALDQAVSDLAKSITIEIFKQQKISKIVIKNNKRLEKEAILRAVKSKPGDMYVEEKLSQDLKNIYMMGYFDDVKVETEKTPMGVIVVVTVKEKPTVRKIKIKGNKVFEDKEIRENITQSSGAILNIIKLKKDVERIKDLYKDKNYQNVKVTHSVSVVEKKHAEIEIVIVEGTKVKIKEIVFEGNNAFSDKRLKKEISLTEKGFFSWLTSSGELKTEGLSQDVLLIKQYYQKNGYAKVRVTEPVVDFRETGIYLAFKIDEGARYSIGRIDITGDLAHSKEELLAKIKLKEGVVYNGEVVYKDMLALSDIYSDLGYANVVVIPDTRPGTGDNLLDINFRINKGKVVSFDEIRITGNYKTRDKVIRRELKVEEQGRYSGIKLKDSVANLKRLDYFEDVKIDTVKKASDDVVDLNIEVKEKRTAAFSFGAGYSSQNSLSGMFSVTEKNLFGRGQNLGFKANVGSSASTYTLSFSEPWLYDKPIYFGVKTYKTENEYTDTINNTNYDYDYNVLGGSVTLGYRIFEFTNVYTSFLYNDVTTDYLDLTTQAQKDATAKYDRNGDYTKNSIIPSIKYDSRDSLINPMKGSNHSFSIEYAGMLGDVEFMKYRAETGWYFPLMGSFVGFIHGKFGYMDVTSDASVFPDVERFYLGGINSVRGYKSRGIFASKDANGKVIGGESFYQVNTEVKFPLIEDKGIYGVVFFDAGELSDSDLNFGDMRMTTGAGVRWFSPLGPIRIEYGQILDDVDPDAGSGRWEFSVGGAF